MTRYEQLQESQKKSKIIYHDYKEMCAVFLKDFFEYLIEYADIPTKKLLIVKNEDKDNYVDYTFELSSIELLMKLEEDGYWHIVVKIILYNNVDPDIIQFPQPAISLSLSFKKENDTYKMKLKQDNESFDVQENDAEIYKKFYDYILNRITYYYENSFMDFINKNISQSKYGFSTEQNIER